MVRKNGLNRVMVVGLVALIFSCAIISPEANAKYNRFKIVLRKPKASKKAPLKKFSPLPSVKAKAGPLSSRQNAIRQAAKPLGPRTVVRSNPLSLGRHAPGVQPGGRFKVTTPTPHQIAKPMGLNPVAPKAQFSGGSIVPRSSQPLSASQKSALRSSQSIKSAGSASGNYGRANSSLFKSIRSSSSSSLSPRVNDIVNIRAASSRPVSQKSLSRTVSAPASISVAKTPGGYGQIPLRRPSVSRQYAPGPIISPGSSVVGGSVAGTSSRGIKARPDSSSARRPQYDIVPGPKYGVLPQRRIGEFRRGADFKKGLDRRVNQESKVRKSELKNHIYEKAPGPLN